MQRVDRNITSTLKVYCDVTLQIGISVSLVYVPRLVENSKTYLTVLNKVFPVKSQQNCISLTGKWVAKEILNKSIGAKWN